MELLLASILFLIGLGLIVKGGDLFVDAAVWMARASGMPQFLIGATIVSLATTMPELVVSSLAALHGNMEMAIGNAVGSVTANTGLILGLSVVMLPIAIVRRHFLFKGLLLVLSCAVLTWICQDGSLTLPEACIMLALFVLFLTENILHARAGAGAQAVSVRLHPPRREIAGNLFFFLVGAISLVVGSRLLVDNGELLAIALGVPTRIIAITLVAIGTSLPELVTAVTALVKRQGSMSVGNILGANLIDITIILPLCSLLSQDALGPSNHASGGRHCRHPHDFPQKIYAVAGTLHGCTLLLLPDLFHCNVTKPDMPQHVRFLFSGVVQKTVLCTQVVPAHAQTPSD